MDHRTSGSGRGRGLRSWRSFHALRDRSNLLRRDRVSECRPMKPELLGVAGLVVIPNEDVVGAAGRLQIGKLGQGSVVTGEAFSGLQVGELKPAVTQVQRKRH